MSDEAIEIDFGDGVSALDRTMRAIVMLADGAITRLTELGWQRKSVNLEISSSDPLPCYVKLRNDRVFEIKHAVLDDGRIRIVGEWLHGTPKGPGVIARFMGH